MNHYKLTFGALREANTMRLPQFKNNNGETAHRSEDGSDWSVAEWLQAVVGEIGEYARVRVDYELGVTSFNKMKEESAKELPDIAIYLDLLALRSLDTNTHALEDDAAFVFMQLMAELGEYANAAKKFIRGDISKLQLAALRRGCLEAAMGRLDALRQMDIANFHTIWDTKAAEGIDLGAAVKQKFNATSEKIGVNVFLGYGGVLTKNLEKE